MYTQHHRNENFVQRYSIGLIAAALGILASLVSVVLEWASGNFQQLAQNWKPLVGIILGFAILFFITATIVNTIVQRRQRLASEDEIEQKVIKS